MPTEEPITTLIDSGMVLCHHKVLRHVPWTWSSIPYRDRDFWSRCGKFWGKDAIRLEHTVISVYNFYGAKIRVRKKIMGVTIKFDIYSRGLARLYVWLGKLLSNHT